MHGFCGIKRMRPSRRITLPLQQIRGQFKETDAFTFFNRLTGAELYEPRQALWPAQRARLFRPTRALAMFLPQVHSDHRPCQRAVDVAACARAASKLPRCSSNTGAYFRGLGCREAVRFAWSMTRPCPCRTPQPTKHAIPAAQPTTRLGIFAVPSCRSGVPGQWRRP